MIPLIKYGYPIIEPYIAYILIFFSALLIIREVKSKFWALIVFLLSGVLGIAVLTMPHLDQPLFPMLSGLFGVSILVVSLMEKTRIPEQRIKFLNRSSLF